MTAQGLHDCLQQAGAIVNPPKAIDSTITEVVATLPNGSKVGIGLTPSPAFAKQFARLGANKPDAQIFIASDGTTVAVFAGSVDPSDKAIVNKCVGQ